MLGVDQFGRNNGQGGDVWPQSRGQQGVQDNNEVWAGPLPGAVDFNQSNA